MKLIKKASLGAVVTVALFSNVAFGQSVFTDAVTVDSVIPSNAGNVLVGASATTNANPASCTNAGFLLSAADAGFRNMYASVLTAFATGGSVSFGIDSQNCVANFPVIQGLIVTPAS